MKKRSVFTVICVILTVGAVLISGGCGGNAGNGSDNIAPHTDGNASGTQAPASADPDNGQTDEQGVASMKELLSVRAVTSITAEDQVYSAISLGVPEDGRSDVSEAVNAAIDAVLEKGGGILYFPSGRYRLSSPLVIDSGKKGWICIAGDPDGSSVFVAANKIDDSKGAAVVIDRDDTHLSFVSFEDNSRAISTIAIPASGCSLYGCSFQKNAPRQIVPCLEISGSFNTVRQCYFGHTNTASHQVEFTKYPGRDAYGNVMCDVHFGGSYTKSTLISTNDPEGCQESLTIARNLYLIPGEPMIEVRAVNGLLICNNMLDAASTAVAIAPDAQPGVYNVEICDNYMGGSKGGVRMEESEGRGANISVHDNYIWSPDSLIVKGVNYTGVSLTYNYCVLTGGHAVFMRKCVDGTVSDELVANIGGGSPELEIMELDKASTISVAGFGSVNIPAESERIDVDGADGGNDGGNGGIPEIPKKTFEGASEIPAVTGDTAAGTLMNGYYNVKDYGAAGDGSTDDTEAVKKCIAAAKSKSGTAYFPAGTYLVTETVKVTKDDSKILTVKGDGAGKTLIVGAETLDGPIFDIRMKYNFNAKDMAFEHRGQGCCVDALYVKAFDCAFTSSSTNTAPLLWFQGSNCWAVRCDFRTANPESYGLVYTRNMNEISINDFITDNTFSGPGKGVKVGSGTTVGDGRCEGLKIHGNTFTNTGSTSVEIYEILHVNIAYNTFDGAVNAIFLSNLGYGPDGIYIDHNIISSVSDCITSGTVEGGGDYISMVVIHDNSLSSVGGGAAVSEPVAFNKKMVRG